MTYQPGIITTVAGTGERGYAGDGGAAASGHERAVHVRLGRCGQPVCCRGCTGGCLSG